jgi:hypothetical protein
MNGTPSYVIGDNVAIGVVGLAALADKVNPPAGQARNTQVQTGLDKPIVMNY